MADRWLTSDHVARRELGSWHTMELKVEEGRDTFDERVDAKNQRVGAMYAVDVAGKNCAGECIPLTETRRFVPRRRSGRARPPKSDTT